jgi:hypothetical protein
MALKNTANLRSVLLQEGLYEDALVCRVNDNPEPVVFPLSVIGAKPQVGCNALWFCITNFSLIQ